MDKGLDPKAIKALMREKQGLASFSRSLQGFAKKEAAVRMARMIMKGGKAVANETVIEKIKALNSDKAIALANNLKSHLIKKKQQLRDRNVQYTRFVRGEESVEELQKSMYGITRGKNISANSAFGRSRVGINVSEKKMSTGITAANKSAGNFALGKTGGTVSAGGIKPGNVGVGGRPSIGLAR